MNKSLIIMDQILEISERFRVELKVYEVKSSKKYPDGIKVRFVLIDVIRKVPRLLLDNHSPYGFHVHEELPKHKEIRRKLEMTDYIEALDEFWRLTKVITNNEN